MVECTDSTCWHRYYKYVLTSGGEVDVDWDKTTFDVKDPDGYEWTNKWNELSDEVHEAAKKAVRRSLKSQKDRGSVKRKCPDGCRCPKSEPPTDDDSLWTKTADPQRKRTTFTGPDKTTYTIHFVAQEFTADVVQPCKELEEEIDWLPPSTELLALLDAPDAKGPRASRVARSRSSGRRSGAG